VATASLSGKTITVTAKGAGTATITVKGSSPGHTGATRAFKVTVHAPTAVKEFEVKDGISPGKVFVFVTLYAPDPGKYEGRVRIGDVVLSYQAEGKKFYGEVIADQAKKENVRVD
jgi:hypothetical protein